MQLYKPEVEAQRFWNPYTQTMPRAELDRLHLRKLQTVIAYAYARSPMYRKLLDRHKCGPSRSARWTTSSSACRSSTRRRSSTPRR